MARIRTGAVQVDGLAELSRSLKKIDKDLSKELREANKGAAEIVADKARTRALSIGGVAAHVAPSLKASAGQQFAAVAMGGSAYPMAGGAEFGAYQYRQFKIWRGNGSDAGYFLYPTIRDDDHTWFAEYESAIDDLIRKAGLA